MTKFSDDAVDLDVSLARHPITDDVKTKTKIEAIKQHVELLLMQGVTATPFKPHVCAGLNDMLFENWSAHTQNMLRTRILSTLVHEPRVTIEDIKLEFDNHELRIDILMKLIDTEKTFNYVSTLRRVL